MASYSLVVALNKDQPPGARCAEGAVLTSGPFRVAKHRDKPFLVSPVTRAESHPLSLAARGVNRLAKEKRSGWRSVAWVAVLK